MLKASKSSFSDVTRLPQRVRVAEVREIEAAVHVDAHIVVLFFPSFSLVVPFQTVVGTRRGNKSAFEFKEASGEFGDSRLDKISKSY